MERYRVTTGYDAGLRQRPTFHANDATPFPTKPRHLREDSFAAHLRPPSSTDDHGRLRLLGEDSELSIFDAERYFNEGDDDHPEEDRVRRKESGFGRADASPDPRESCSDISSLDGGRRIRNNGSLYATPTASSEASWNSRSGLLTNAPGSVAVTVRAFPLNQQRRGSSTSVCKWLLGRSCPCSGRKDVEVQEKYSVPMSPSHSNLYSIASVSLKKKDSRSGDACADEFATALKELEMGSEWEMPKLKLVAGNWIKQQDVFTDPCDHLYPGKHFPPEMTCHRIVRAGKPFKDGGGPTAFSFPVLQVQPISPSGKPENSGVSTTPLDAPRRDSLEVFRPLEEAKHPKNSSDLQRLAVTQTQTFPRLDGGPCRSFTFPPSPSGRVSAVEDDLASDSSSDLFEIENLSTQGTSCTGYCRRDSLEELRCPARTAAPAVRVRRGVEEPATLSVGPSECYPPSEVSVEWSVATAEGGFGPGSVANFSSAASDYDNAGFTQVDHAHAFSVALAGGGGKRRGGGLLNCRCEKAVSVGPSLVRLGAERRHQLPSEEGGVRAAARVRNGSSTVAHLARAAGGPVVARQPSLGR